MGNGCTLRAFVLSPRRFGRIPRISNLSLIVQILIVDDERVVRESLKSLLVSEGYEVRLATDGATALAQIRRKTPDLVLLDVMMPGKNGFAVCREIRQDYPLLPILFLTAKDSEGDELRGFGVGADDYLAKTTSEPLLLARIAALLRRSERFSTVPEEQGFPIAEGFVATDRQIIRVGTDESSLTVREIEILRWFSQHPGEVCSIDCLLTHFWGSDADLGPSTVHMQIKRLREKLGSVGLHLSNIRGQGYVFSL